MKLKQIFMMIVMILMQEAIQIGQQHRMVTDNGDVQTVQALRQLQSRRLSSLKLKSEDRRQNDTDR